MSLPSDIDVAIIGAGAAGLGAANTLINSGRSLLVLEARDRLGGRAWTINPTADIVFDVGCGWLHSADDNSFVGIANELGFELDQTRPRWRDQSAGIGYTQAERESFLQELDAFWDRVDAAAEKDQDVAASTFLQPGNRWNRQLNALSSYISGVELDHVSVKDFAAYHDTQVNWRVRRGYGALVAAYGAAVPVALNTQVTTIDHSARRIKIDTIRGSLTAAQVIITVPSNILAQERIRFLPKLPDKVDAAAGLPLGVADKVTIALSDPDSLPVEGHMRGAFDRTETGSYQLRPFGQPCIEGFFGGSYARALEEAGESALADAAIEEIVKQLGSNYRKRLKPLAASRWALDEFALGSYSCALPGRFGDRVRLARPVDNRLFFAGEATHARYFSTCHGARDSGERAATELLAAV